MHRRLIPIACVMAGSVLASTAYADEGVQGESTVQSETRYSDDPYAPERVNRYGVGVHARWVSVPGWFLDLFTDKNVPLSSYGFGLELMQRRKGELDIVLGVGYQRMSPPDGNWVGSGNDPRIDTDYVQFKNLGFIGLDLSFIWRVRLAKFMGLHYGGGIGLAFVTGSMYRTSSSGACTADNVDDLTLCHPVGATCTASGCTGLVDGPENQDSASSPRRFKDGNVPPVIPIVNLVLGVNFRIPSVKGLELRLEGGFHNAFVMGAGASYTF